MTDRRSMINRHRERGPIAAVFPIHYPRSLLWAHGILPVEVWGPPGADLSPGDAHVQAYVCSIVRAGLGFLKSGGLRDADLLLLPHGCDSLQGLASILLDYIKPDTPVLPLYIPRGQRGSDVAYLTRELRALDERLAEVSGRSPDEAALREAVAQDEAADLALAELHRALSEAPLDPAAHYRRIRSREYLSPELFLEQARADETPAGADGPGILLSGIVPEPFRVLQAVADAGGRIVGDDYAACGRRLYPAGTSNDPFERMAERIVHGPPDPLRGSPIGSRIEHLLGLAKRTSACGLIFHVVQYCEPELFDLPMIRAALQEAGLPSLVLETEVDAPLSDTATNRIDAFMEMLS